MRCYESGQYYFAPTTQWLIDLVGRYLAILNSSINFFIYCLVGTEFRSTLFKMFSTKNNMNVPDINIEQAPSLGENNINQGISTASSLLRIEKISSIDSSSSLSSQSVSCISIASSHLTDTDTNYATTSM